MRVTVLLLALAGAFSFAADDAAIAPRTAANLQSTIANHQSPVANRLDAITIPQMLSYQGRLTDSLGQPVADTTYSVEFRLYTVPSGGSPFWSETQTVRTQSGLFAVLLGAATPIGSVPDAGAAYLVMAVGGGAELAPRLRIAGAAYAYLSERSANSDLLQGQDTAAFDARFVNEGQGGSVTSGMIVNGTIAATDIGNGAVTSNKILDGTIRTEDLADTAVTMAKIARAGATTRQVVQWTGSGWAPGNDSVGGAGDNAWTRVGSDSVLYTVRKLGIAKGDAGNVLRGESTCTHVNLGVACTTGTITLISGHVTVSGGFGNTATDRYTTVGGGYGNGASDYCATVGGGSSNTATGNHTTVDGGEGNTATRIYATVGGGAGNAAQDTCATVAGGWGNGAGGTYSTVGGGNHNAADGKCATVPGGKYCHASGTRSFAAGTYAKARGVGSFVWSDDCTEGDSVRNSTDNRFVARARGGVYFYTNLGMTTGSYLSPGGSSWNSVSDSMTKENFRPVDKQALLEALAEMRVRDYNLKSQDASIRHIGPVAQDFHSAFGFGESNTAINMEDADGVALAAIQALYEQNQVLSKRVAELEAKLAGQ